ncbi:hypothetical protein GZ78_17510 [Endozoicomonas numazuensis]|uniref:Uncharacterized protein n=2 Tax=Endozoicomonas numazuensis TaxID=1137799 RepID=A0A081NGG9_9GAMM|nr:hypothetical protein GZ78_17510 [Endozoicomonas numazuensis]
MIHGLKLYVYHTETKELGKEKKVVSVFNRTVLTNVCMELSDLDELPQPKNISEYHLSTLTGESVGKFLAINMDKNHSRAHQLNICNKQDGYFELFNSHEISIESALQDYIVNLHLQETHASKKWTSTIYIMALTLGSGVINYIASYLVDYASFYLLIGSCAICFNQVQYPGVQACAHHWFCVFSYERARLEHPRNCPLCGV